MEKEKKFIKSEYDQAYVKENCKKFCLKFFNNSDAEVIKKMQSVPNKTDYIRQLVLNDINSKQNSNL